MLRHITRNSLCLGPRQAGGVCCVAARRLSQAQPWLTTQAALESMPTAKVTRLQNGIRAATETTHSDTATVAVMVEAGSRFETPETNGVAKLLEHTIMKGTMSRSQTAIEQEIERLGGQLNMVTDREYTALYTTTAASDALQALSLLSDIVQHPTVPEESLAMARDTLLREMQDVDQGQLDQVILNHLHTTGYQGSPLAHNVLGTSRNAAQLTRQHILDYHKANFAANRLVVSIAGNVDHHAAVKAVEKHFGALGTVAPITANHPRVIGSDLRHRDDEMAYGHVGVAVEGVGWLHPDHPTLEVAAVLLGSWNKSLSVANNLSSPLAQQCCKEHICESYTHFNHSHTDTGLFGVYFVCDRLTTDDILHECLCEWMRVAINARESEVERAKNIAKFNVLAKLDSTLACAHDIGRQVLAYDRRVPIAETIARIDAVDVKGLRSVLTRHVYDRDPVVAAVGPVEALQDYNRIQSGLWWARF